MEIWKDIEGYEERYQVSNRGRVRNRLGYILTPVDNGKGYLRFSLSNGRKNSGKTHYLHRLMAVAFIPNPNNLPEVNHKDEDKQNNNLSNLEWCDVPYNRTYGSRIERSAKARSKRVIGTKLIDGSSIVLDSVADAERLGLNKSAVSNCLQGLSKSSGGYTWRYASYSPRVLKTIQKPRDR